MPWRGPGRGRLVFPPAAVSLELGPPEKQTVLTGHKGPAHSKGPGPWGPPNTAGGWAPLPPSPSGPSLSSWWSPGSSSRRRSGSTRCRTPTAQGSAECMARPQSRVKGNGCNLSSEAQRSHLMELTPGIMGRLVDWSANRSACLPTLVGGCKSD